jgi:Cys-rich protein (TIGR01571 family)
MDFVGLITFNDNVSLIAADTKGDVNLAPFWRMSPDGGTALYDAIVQMTAVATKQHITLTQALPIPVISYVIVLTDGEDTSSKISLEETRQLFAVVNRVQNFKVILAGINLNYNARRALESLGAVGDKDIEFRDLNSNADIENLFEHFTLQLKLQRTVAVVDPRTGAAAAVVQTAYVDAGAIADSPPRPSRPAITYSPSPAASPARPSYSSAPLAAYQVEDGGSFREGPRAGTRDWDFWLCGCLGNCGLCLCSFILPCCVWSFTASKVSSKSCLGFFLIYTLFWAIIVGAVLIMNQIVTREEVSAYTTYIVIGAGVILILLAAYMRGKLREKGRINGNCLFDICAHLWCHPCAVTQEARQIAIV